MLNVFVLCRDNPAAAAQSLAALVPGVVLGHVGRAVMQIDRESDALRGLAEGAGCDLVIGENPAKLFSAARSARPGWWLVMREGQILTDGWSDEAARHISLRQAMAVAFPARGFWSVTKARLARVLRQPRTAHHVLLVPPEQALANRGMDLGCVARAMPLRAAFGG